MKTPIALVLMSALALTSCNQLPEGFQEARIKISETRNAKIINFEGTEGNLFPTEKGQEFIIIQNLDTARFVLVESSQLLTGSTCDGVYHNPGQGSSSGKDVLVAKGGANYHFIIIQDVDTAYWRIDSQVSYPADAGAILSDLPGGGFKVQNLTLSDNTTIGFDFGN